MVVAAFIGGVIAGAGIMFLLFYLAFKGGTNG